MSIGSNIRKYRKLKKLTQKQLGDLIGRSDITIRNYEADRILPPIDIIRKIADILEVKESDLSLGEEERKEIQSNYELLDPFVLEKIDEYITDTYEFSDYAKDLDTTTIIEHILIAWFAQREAMYLAGINEVDLFIEGTNGLKQGFELFEILYINYVKELKKDKRLKDYIELREMLKVEDLESPWSKSINPSNKFIKLLKDYDKKYGIEDLNLDLGYLAIYFRENTPKDRYSITKILFPDSINNEPKEGD